MSDEPEIVVTPPVGDAPTPETPPAGDPAEPTTRIYTAAEFRAVQNEAKNLRARLRDLETTVTGHAPALEALRAEAETARSQVAALTDEARGYRLRQAISDAGRDADDLRGIDPDLVAPHLTGVEWGDDGRPKAIAAALRGVLKRFPQIAATPAPRVPTQPPAGGGRPAGDAAVITQEKRSLIGRPL
jgi:hypothetical protein